MHGCPAGVLTHAALTLVGSACQSGTTDAVIAAGGVGGGGGGGAGAPSPERSNVHDL